jgi:hypothetical protein
LLSNANILLRITWINATKDKGSTEETFWNLQKELAHHTEQIPYLKSTQSLSTYGIQGANWYSLCQIYQLEEAAGAPEVSSAASHPIPESGFFSDPDVPSLYGGSLTWNQKEGMQVRSPSHNIVVHGPLSELQVDFLYGINSDTICCHQR